MNGIRKCFIRPFGNALVASYTFAAGDVVLRDWPMLATTEDIQLIDNIYAAHSELGIRADLLGKDASIDFTLQLLQYCAASVEVKASVRELFTPDTQEFQNEPYVRAAQHYAAQIERLCQAEAASDSVLGPIFAACLGSNEIVRVVLAWVCNSYATRDGGGALYKVGSLVNHCCEGNTRYRFVDDGQEGGGCGVFIAVRQILPGEVITTCYLGWDEQTLMSTRMRQKLLAKTKLFTCTCVRCSSRRDPYRALPCPRCNSHTPCNGLAAADHTASGDSSGTPLSATAVAGAEPTVAAFTGAASANDARATTAMNGSDERGDSKKEANEGCDSAPELLAGRPNPGHAPQSSLALSVGPGASGCSGGVLGAVSGGFVYWTSASAGAVAGAGGSRTGHWDVCSQSQPPTVLGPEPQSCWECDTCGSRFGAIEMQRELQRRAAAVGMGPKDWRNDGNNARADGHNLDLDPDPELALEEEVQGVGEQLDWTDLAVSLGAVRQLGARCQAVLGQRHWTTNRCRYTVLELCTAALTRTCAASLAAASACSGGAGGCLPEGCGSVGGGSYCGAAAAAGAAGSGWGWLGGFSGSSGGVPWRFGSSSDGPRPVVGAPPAAASCIAADGAGDSGGNGAGSGDGDQLPSPHQRAQQPATETVDGEAAAQESEGDGDLDCGRVDTGLAAGIEGRPGVPASRGAELRDTWSSGASELRALAAAGAGLAAAAEGGGLVALSEASTAQGPAAQGSAGPVPVHGAEAPAGDSRGGNGDLEVGTAGFGQAQGRAAGCTTGGHTPPLQPPPAPPPQQQQQESQQPLVGPSQGFRPSACAASGSALFGLGGGDTGSAKQASPAGSGPGSGPKPVFPQEASLEVPGSAGSPEPPHVNPHLGRAALLLHTLHHHNLHQQQRQQRPDEPYQGGSWQATQRQSGGPPQQLEAITAASSAAAKADSPPSRNLASFAAGGYGGGGLANPVAVFQREPSATEQQQPQSPPASPPPQVPEQQPSPDALDGTAASAASRLLPPDPDVPGSQQEPLPPPSLPLPLSEVGAVRSVGGSTLWGLPLLEVDGMVDCICEELQALWQWQQHHTPHEPAVVLKAVAGPAATALMDVVKDELCSGGRLSSRALALAEAVASRLAAAYEAAPFYDVSGEAYEEAVTVVQLAPLIREVLDLEPEGHREGNTESEQEN